MNGLDEAIDQSSKKRGRPQRLPKNVTQHSIYIDPVLWEASGNLPISRPEIIRKALEDAVAFYQSDLEKLKSQHRELQKKIMDQQAQDSVILERIDQLEAKAVYEEGEKQKAQELVEIAVSETLTMCKAHKRSSAFRIGFEQYQKLEQLSGIDAAKIETFLKDNKFRPLEGAVRVFYNG